MRYEITVYEIEYEPGEVLTHETSPHHELVVLDVEQRNYRNLLVVAEVARLSEEYQDSEVDAPAN